jgi:pseudouridine synthase
VSGTPDEQALDRLRRGVPLDGRFTLPADVKLLGARRGDRHSVLVMTIREGRNRQIRRMCEAVGHPVRALARVRIGPLADRRLTPGQWRDLTDEEIRMLKKAVARTAAPSHPRTVRT